MRSIVRPPKLPPELICDLVDPAWADMTLAAREAELVNQFGWQKYRANSIVGKDRLTNRFQIGHVPCSLTAIFKTTVRTELRMRGHYNDQLHLEAALVRELDRHLHRTTLHCWAAAGVFVRVHEPTPSDTRVRADFTYGA